MSEDIRNYTTCDVTKFPGRALGPCAHHDSEQNRLTGRQAEQSRSVHKYSKSKQQIGLDKLQTFASNVQQMSQGKLIISDTTALSKSLKVL